MDIQTIMLIIVTVTLLFVSLCYFFDTREYKAGTVHSERQYNYLKGLCEDLTDENSKLLNKYEEAHNAFEIKTNELMDKISGQNSELEKKDLELEQTYSQIDSLKAQIKCMKAAEKDKETNNDSEKV